MGEDLLFYTEVKMKSLKEWKTNRMCLIDQGKEDKDD